MRRNVLGAAALLTALAGCKAKDAPPVASADSATAAATSNAPDPNVVAVRAKDYAFEAPTQIPSGMTTFRLVNDGTVLHHIVIMRLDSGKTMTDLTKAMADTKSPPPVWMVPMSGPNAPDPTRESNATVDLQPGSYAMICLIDMPGGVPHFMKGMTHAFTVVPSTGPTAAAPAADETVTLSDYDFALSKPLTAGTHTFAIKNTAQQPHEAFLAKLAPGKTQADLLSWIAKPNGPPPGSAVGGVTPFVGGTTYFTADISAGNYVLICFVPDAKDGKPHFTHGMVKTLTVS